MIGCDIFRCIGDILRRHAAGVCIALMVFATPFMSAPVLNAMESGEERIAKGQVIFVKYCAGCHGPQGKGDGYRLLGRQPADLTEPAIQQRPSAELLRSIHEGKPNMPPWNARLSKDDARDVLAYIRTLPQERHTGEQ